MASPDQFNTWCFPLERSIQKAGRADADCRTHATLLDFAELSTDREKTSSLQFPGLSRKVAEPPTKYVLCTSHSKIPGHDHLSEWRFSSEYLKEEKVDEKDTLSLANYVSGVWSCCGNDSFVEPGDTVAFEHHKKSCKLGLNVTLLFLNECFERDFQCDSPPIATGYRDITLVHNALLHNQRLPSDSIGTFGVVAYSSSNESATTTNCISTVTLQKIESQEATHPTSDSKLEEEMVMFEITKTVGYKRVDGSSNRWSDVGMPLVNTVAGQDARPIGVVTEEGKAITFAALFYILEGRPCACLSLLRYRDMWRLWVNKWCHLLVPYIHNTKMSAKDVLEVLMLLPNNEKKVTATPTDSVKTKMAFLEFLQLTFHCFQAHSKEAITAMTDEVCTVTHVSFEEFKGKLTHFCTTLLTLLEDCCKHREPMSENVKKLAEQCSRSVEALLNYKHNEDIIENLIFTKELPAKLSHLRKKCCKSKECSGDSFFAIMERHIEVLYEWNAQNVIQGKQEESEAHHPQSPDSDSGIKEYVY